MTKGRPVEALPGAVGQLDLGAGDWTKTKGGSVSGTRTATNEVACVVNPDVSVTTTCTARTPPSPDTSGKSAS